MVDVSKIESKGELQREEPPQTREPPPDGGLKAWLVVFACFLFLSNTFGLNYAFGVYQAHYSIHAFPNDPPELISLIGSISTALTLGLGMFVGRAVERFGPRKVALVGSVVLVLSLTAAGFCRTIPQLIITQGLFCGIGSGMLFIPATVAPTQWFLKRRSFAMGIAAAGSGAGGIFWSIFTRVVVARLGYRKALWLSACISACVCAVALAFLKTKPVPPAPRTSFWAGLAMFKNPKFFTLYCASSICIFGYMVPYFYVPSYAQIQLHTNSATGSNLSAVLDLAMVVGRVVLGLAGDSRLGTVNAVVSSMAIAGLYQLALWLPATKSLALLYVFAFVYGFFGGGYIGLLPSVLARIFDGDKLPSITGLFFSSELMGNIAGGPIAGAILSASHGSWTPVILYSGLTVSVGSLFGVATRFQVERRVFATV